MINNNKGVTLASIVIIIIIIIIMASVSIVAGNALMKESKEHADEQKIIAVTQAIKEIKSEVAMSGTLIPGDAAYVGTRNPLIGRDEAGVEQYAGDDWYLLEESHLKELGIEGDDTNYIVNYKLEVVLPMDSTDTSGLYEEIIKY